MVKMENIEKNGNIITVDCYEEGDKQRSHHVVFDVNTLEFKNDAVNNIYTRQGVWRLLTILKEGSVLPKTASSYWC